MACITPCNINGYEVRAWRDREKNGGGLIEFVRKAFICKRLKKLEPKSSEVICLEFTIQTKNGFASVSIGHLHKII